MARPPKRRATTHPLTYVRANLGWTFRDLAEYLAQETRMAAHPQKVWRWENRGVVPETDAQLILARKLGVPEHVVRERPWPEWLPSGTAGAIEAPWTVDGLIDVLDSVLGVDSVDRRGFLTLASGAALQLSSAWAAAPEMANRDPAPDDLVASFAQRLSVLRAEEDMEGGGIRELLDIEMRSATWWLRRAASRGTIPTRLAAVVADLARVTGWAHVDAGGHAAAEHRFVTGLRAAHAAGDRLAGANLLKCMSLLLLDNERPTEALGVAQTASRMSANAPAQVRAMLAVREARVLAALPGEQKACEATLLHADRLMERAGADDEVPEWAVYFDKAEYHAQVASCYLGMGRHEISERWLDHALALQPVTRERDGVTYGMWRVETAIRQGQLDEGCDYLQGVLPRMSRSSARNLARLVEIRALLAPYRDTPCVRDLDEQAHALIA